MTDEFAACIGIDWADQKHDVALLPAGCDHVEARQLDQTPEAIDAWATELRRRFGGRPIAVCLEQSKGGLIYGLMKYEFLVLYPINPKQLARFREALAPSGSKDDSTDAVLALQLLVKHRDQLRPWRPDDAQTRLIRILAEDRRGLVEQRTRLCNQLQDRLKQVFPLALEVLGSLTTDLAAEFLARYSSFEELRQAQPEEVAALYRLHGLGQAKIQERLARIAAATPLATDSALVNGGRLLVRSLATQLRALAEPLRQYNRQLADAMRLHPDAPIFQSFPGAGDALAPRLLAAFGADRRRLDNAAQMQDLSGIAPVTRRSGKSLSILRRWAASKFLRQTFHEFAQHSLPRSAWAKAYYDLQRQRGKKHHAAVRALAFKWIRILFRCWKQHLCYDELIYCAQLLKRRSPLLTHLATTPIPTTQPAATCT
jgi:transposase